jgi:hypothetical protein
VVECGFCLLEFGGGLGEEFVEVGTIGVLDCSDGVRRSCFYRGIRFYPSCSRGIMYSPMALIKAEAASSLALS